MLHAASDQTAPSGRKRFFVVLAALVLASVVGSCRKECSGAACAEPGKGPVVLSFGKAGEVRSFTVEVAATSKERRRGLMNRSSLDSQGGMLFLFTKTTTGPFWMKNTLIELDIAFIQGDTVVDVRRMTPCKADPCPYTYPSGPYDKAFEASAGALASLKPGDVVKIEGNLPRPS